MKKKSKIKLLLFEIKTHINKKIYKLIFKN